MRSVYNWMMLGLCISGFTAYFAGNSSGVRQMIFGNSFTIWILFIAELGLVFAISGGINRMTASTASGLFLMFSFINGLTLSSIFLVYTSSSIASTFFITGLTFGAMSAYGYFTKTDLTSWGKYLFMALIGVIIASVVNMFLHNPAVDWLVSYIGIIVFVGLTAYDTQKIRRLGENMGAADSEQFAKIAVVGALALYLDFINLFLMLLRLFGRGRD
ncbi:MAG TPA: Bax inhibitor-1/YccA family protein [Nitrospirae bacterium]|nr:Bax inhibitor-1/YccA family protein [Nitrospirota bacterium]HDZ00784.1 Bax inhibitor-1/YccA family protein [Nitrospirota bacterium]